MKECQAQNGRTSAERAGPGSRDAVNPSVNACLALQGSTGAPTPWPLRICLRDSSCEFRADHCPTVNNRLRNRQGLFSLHFEKQVHVGLGLSTPRRH